MLNSIRAKVLAAVFLGLAAALTPVRQADAAMFVGTFDPAFGTAFPRLGFNGTATFQVADSCLAQTGFCTDSPIDMLSATVNLYDLLSSSTDQLTFGFSSLSNVYILGGTLYGVTSQPMPPQFGTVNDGIVFSGNVYLQFVMENFNQDVIGIPSAYIFACPDTNRQCSADVAIRSNRADLLFVPEPSTAALLFIALVAAVRLRRRVR